MTNGSWSITTDIDDPIVATAIHAGHDLSDELRPFMALDDATRLREEDPFTDRWLPIAANQVRVTRSRFEVDLNRPREEAVYRDSAAAWGLELWNQPLTEEAIAGALAQYDTFYRELSLLLDVVAAEHARFVVFDLHSYNHRRGGPNAPVDDPEANPEINVGTGSVDAGVWGDVTDAFSTAMSGYPFDGGHLDVRENVRFRGGHMSRWINERYAGRGCALAIEVKKFFMNEWTGTLDEESAVNIGDALQAAANSVREALSL